MNILKEEIHDINDLTKAGNGFGAQLKFFVLDELAVTFGAQRSGSSFVDDKPEDMQIINAELDGTDMLSTDTFLKMDLISLGLIAYIGNSGPTGRFSPTWRPAPSTPTGVSTTTVATACF